MNILSYFNIIVNIRALLPFIMYKATYFFDFLIIAPCFINPVKWVSTKQGKTIKGSFPIQEGPLDLPIYKITICKINKISYNKHKNL